MHANGVIQRLAPAGLSAWILCPIFTGARSLISLVAERQRATVHANSSNSSSVGRQRATVHPNHRLRDASSHSLMRVDAVRAMWT